MPRKKYDCKQELENNQMISDHLLYPKKPLKTEQQQQQNQW